MNIIYTFYVNEIITNTSFGSFRLINNVSNLLLIVTV